MTQLPPDRPDRPAYQLDYASPDQQRPAGGVPYGWQVALGFAAFVVTGFVAVLLLAMSRGGGAALLMVGVLVFVTLATLNVVARERWRWRGFLLGVLIGLGLALLGAGLCVVVVLSSLH
ncbi:MAG: hypothetical protein ACHRHE_12520 [Tepidisphaerales bacterium]